MFEKWLEQNWRRTGGILSVSFMDLAAEQAWAWQSRPLRAASLIKLFIMVEAFRQIEAGRLSVEESLTFCEADRVGGAGSLQQMPSGSRLKLLDLVELMITESDNIATNLLMERLEAERINRCILSLGCTDTRLQRKMMDFAAAANGRENTTSVTDVVKVLSEIYRNRCATADSCRQMQEILARQTDRCKLPLLLPPDTLCRHKTGELPGAEHDAGIVETPRGHYAIAVMTDELADNAAGTELVAQISRFVYDEYCGVNPLRAR